MEHEARGGITVVRDGAGGENSESTSCVRAERDGDAVVRVERVVRDTLDGTREEWSRMEASCRVEQTAAGGRVTDAEMVVEKLRELWMRNLSEYGAPFAEAARHSEDARHVVRSLPKSAHASGSAQRASSRATGSLETRCQTDDPSMSRKRETENVWQLVLQMDGLYEDDEDSEYEQQGAGPGASAGGSGAVADGKGVKREHEDDGSDSEPPLNSDDDMDGGDDDPDDAIGEEPETGNLILAQYEKVMRKPDKWKVQLKDGIAVVNERDYLFSKALCDLEW
ncbi:Transcription initiation factor IIA subunit 1 [Porphyridium purpureum]|uniref:Transcription initiation factor IIA subunit 1 n=1 Tax=Porphyridium purpureum TaxID=35688 RepID=A0A5J4Z7G5_PORPP|nr:Transcription initiation factor IIA subunit 1 [Porphyridium purpureum]|eukprot:POR3900..scf295_1